MNRKRNRSGLLSRLIIGSKSVFIESPVEEETFELLLHNIYRINLPTNMYLM